MGHDFLKYMENVVQGNVPQSDFISLDFCDAEEDRKVLNKQSEDRKVHDKQIEETKCQYKQNSQNRTADKKR